MKPAAFIACLALVCQPALPADVVVGKASESAIRARVLALVNEARAAGRRCGSEQFASAAPLEDSPSLRKAAQRHADDMARRKYFDHRGADGSQPKDRVQRSGYKPRLTGENIAFAPESAEEVVAGWLASPGHCANIMDTRFTDTGVGVATGRQRGHIYWVQTFGWPLPR
jgi:uncharacterized protein YkwD